MTNQKLSAQFDSCSYKVLERIRGVAYRLELSIEATIYFVFHVSKLKGRIGTHFMTFLYFPRFATTSELDYFSKTIINYHRVHHNCWLVKEYFV